MSYTPQQIGEIEVRDFSGRTKDRMSLVLIQHGRERGHDERHIAAAGDGAPLRPARDALWWTTEDDALAAALRISPVAYALGLKQGQ